MDEELDYMSDEFIKNSADNAKDVRPGLLKTHSALRQHYLLKKKNLELMKKPTDVLQAEVLEESLKQPINSTNKGFSMLEKMGFKSGMGLGKDNSGIKEPIGINIKKDKVGLGHKSLNQIKVQNKKSKLESINEDDYRAFLSKRNRERECLSDFRKSQRICQEFDLKCNKSVPNESWFWPNEEPSEVQSETSESDDDYEELELNIGDKLEIITKYLREKYFYCIWCRVQYNDEKDLEDCPGATRDDH